MPCFRGIELSLAATGDNRVFSEFPHPDGSSTNRLSFKGRNSPKLSKHKSAIFSSPRPWGAAVGDGPIDDSQQADPRISVYIPSEPDSNFYIYYRVSQPPVGHKYLFFKVWINGRQVVSWGVNLHKTTAGAARQALFAPSAYYQYEVDGVVMAQPGIESRSFRFVGDSPSSQTGQGGGGRAAPSPPPLSSLAADGGLIEVQAFRARARVRRAAQPAPFREDTSRYGVALISNGLLDRPHLASYYDYYLSDAKDAPHASFRFHYRSWESLRLLQLAPSPGEPQKCTGRQRQPALRPLPLPPLPGPLLHTRTSRTVSSSSQDLAVTDMSITPSLEAYANGEEGQDERCEEEDDDDVFQPLHRQGCRPASRGMIVYPFTDDLCKQGL